MLQHTRHAEPPLGALGRARALATRGALGLGLVTAVMLALLGVSSTSVGAVVTDASKAPGNRFEAAVHVDAGVLDLGATPAAGEFFGPGEATGTVSFKMQPEGSAALALRTGETMAVEVDLPEGSRPGALPDRDSGERFVREWSATETESRWTVRAAVTATADGNVALPAGAFPISTAFAHASEERAREITARAETPERLVSALPSASATIPAAWQVTTGIYALGGWPSSGTTAEVSFRSHPTPDGETLFLRAGESLRTTVELPAGVTPGALPAKETADGLSTEWTSHQDGAEWRVVLTRTAQEDVSHVAQLTSGFPVSVSPELAGADFAVRGSTVLPARFHSTQPVTDGTVRGSIQPPTLSSISAGGGHSMMLTPEGEIYGWGANLLGQVGVGNSSTSVNAPGRVGARVPQGFAQLSAGAEHTVALGRNGTIYGWGARQYSLAGGTIAAEPVQVNSRGTGPFTQVSAGTDHSLALGPNGRAYGWGNRYSGALGEPPAGSTMTWATPLTNPAGVEFIQVEAGVQSSYGVGSDGRVWAMGVNRYGQLGLGTDISTTRTFTAVPMPGDARIAQIASNSSTNLSHTIALTTSGELIAWGANGGGQAGTALDGSTPPRFTEPTRIQAPAGVTFTQVAVGDGVSLALASDGTVYSWGSTAQGVDGGGSSVPRPVTLPAGAAGSIGIAAGDLHAFAVGADQQLYGWGAGAGGRLGNNSAATHATPILIALDGPRSSSDDAAEDALDEPDSSGTQVDAESQPGVPEDAAPEGDGDGAGDGAGALGGGAPSPVDPAEPGPESGPARPEEGARPEESGSAQAASMRAIAGIS